MDGIWMENQYCRESKTGRASAGRHYQGLMLAPMAGKKGRFVHDFHFRNK